MEKFIICVCVGVLSIVVEMMLILLDVSDGISVENIVCCMFILKLFVLFMVVMVLIIIFWMEFVFMFRNVNGMFVVVVLML